MPVNKTKRSLELFFGHKFRRLGKSNSILEMRFCREALNYSIMLDGSFFRLSVDPNPKNLTFPLIEIELAVDRVEQIETIGGNLHPVLIFWCQNAKYLHITRTATGSFSIAPNWKR